MTSTTKRENLERIAADLMGRRCYVCLKSEGLPDGFASPKVAGLFHRRLDVTLMEHLKATGRWQGRQTAIYVDDVYDEGQYTLATVAHELAHACDGGLDETEPEMISKPSMDLMRINHKRGIENPVQPVDSVLGYEPGHGPRFARAAMHLWFRCHLLGHWFPFEHLYAGSLYGIPEPTEIRNALDDELGRLLQLPVELVLTLPAPKAFDELFKNRKDKQQ